MSNPAAKPTLRVTGDGLTRFNQLKPLTNVAFSALFILLALITFLPVVFVFIISIMFILNVGSIFSTDFGLFFQVTRDSNSLIDVTQTLDVYVYKALMQSNNYNYSAAASLLQNTLGCILLIVANLVVKKIDPDSGLF